MRTKRPQRHDGRIEFPRRRGRGRGRGKMAAVVARESDDDHQEANDTETEVVFMRVSHLNIYFIVFHVFDISITILEGGRASPPPQYTHVHFQFHLID